MRVYNTLSKQKETFTPLHPGIFNIYVCGPTVYNYIHVGNARPAVVFDTLRRYLEYKGDKVNYISNITDVDDKIMKRAAEEKTTPEEIARRYEGEYFTDLRGLNVRPATVHPRATEHIAEMQDIIAAIMEKGYAYARPNGDVYFRARKFAAYGKLSHQPLEALESGARVDVNEDKEDPMDFALWKGAKPGELAWDSPWGKGRPGWHIECSAMSKKHLGETIDLHAGGADLVFPHHENEIAQSECANGKPFARYWMHNGFLSIDNQKMSKSLGNFFTVREVAEKYGYEPIRYFLLTGQYRGPLNFSAEALDQAKNSLARLYNARGNLSFLLTKAPPKGDDSLAQDSQKALADFEAAMDDDLNTPDALAALFGLVTAVNTKGTAASQGALAEAQHAFDTMADVLGILYQRPKQDIPEAVEQLLSQRAEARGKKDWKKSDEIRAALRDMGWDVEDTKHGQKASKLS